MLQLILFGAATANAIDTFLDDLHEKIDNSTDFEESERILSSIRAQQQRSIKFHPTFNKLHVTFVAEVLNFENQNRAKCPDAFLKESEILPDTLSCLRNLFSQIWSLVDRLPVFLRLDCERYFFELFYPVCKMWLDFSLAHKLSASEQRDHFATTLESFSLRNFEIPSEKLVSRLRNGDLQLYHFYQALYSSFVFLKRDRNYIRGVSSALAYQFSTTGNPIYELDPFWYNRVQEIMKVPHVKIFGHGCTLTLETLTAVSEAWLKTGTDLDLWRVSVLWCGFFLALRTADLFNCRRSSFKLDHTNFWIASKNPTATTHLGKYHSYLPKLRYSLWDTQFWFKILDNYRDPQSDYLFVVPGKLKQGCMKFNMSKFARYFLGPLNDLLEEMGKIPYGKRFTIPSFRYTLASVFYDELHLPDNIVSACLKQTQCPAPHSQPAQSVYELSTAQCLDFQVALEKYASKNLSLGNIFSSNRIAVDNKKKYERFWKWAHSPFAYVPQPTIPMDLCSQETPSKTTLFSTPF